jgi:hypothetical protein
VRLLFAHLGLEYETVDVSVVDRSNCQEHLGDLNPGPSRPDRRPRRRLPARGVKREGT